MSMVQAGAVIAAATFMTGCVSFGISTPTDGAIIRSSPVSVSIAASPSMSGLTVTLDGADVTAQMSARSGTTSTGSITPATGRKSVLVAQADVPCSYCSSNHLQSQVSFCVVPASPTSSVKIPLADRDTLSWSKTSDTGVGLAQQVSTAIEWDLRPAGGIGGGGTGMIASVDNLCLCMRSMDDQQNTPIGLAICDANDSTQKWQALQTPSTGTAYRIQNTGRAISDACLTEGPGNVLVQKACNDTPDQLWRFKDTSTGRLVSPF
jgi:hypothetical protein